jgi:hypothetical protein
MRSRVGPHSLCLKLPNDEDVWSILTPRMTLPKKLLFVGNKLIAEFDRVSAARGRSGGFEWDFGQDEPRRVYDRGSWRKVVLKSDNGKVLAIGRHVGCSNRSVIVIRPSYGHLAGALALMILSIWDISAVSAATAP